MNNIGLGLNKSSGEVDDTPYRPATLFSRDEDFTQDDVDLLSPYVTNGTLSLGTETVGGKSNYLILTVDQGDNKAVLSIPGDYPTILAAPQANYGTFASPLGRFFLSSTIQIPTTNSSGNHFGSQGVSASEGAASGASTTQKGVWSSATQNYFQGQSKVFYNFAIADTEDGDDDPESGDELYISKIVITYADV